MGVAFVPLALTTAAHQANPAQADGWAGYAVALAPVVVSTVLLTLATMIVYPFEMATIVNLSGYRMVGTYYGLYTTLAGIGIAVGNVATGVAIDAGRDNGLPTAPWIALAATGALCAVAVAALRRRGHLDAPARPAGPAGVGARSG
jgi:hypothetical protein